MHIKILNIIIILMPCVNKKDGVYRPVLFVACQRLYTSIPLL